MASGSITFIYADDFNASCAFYEKTLSLPVAGAMGDGVRVFMLPGAYLAVVKQGTSAAADPPVCARTAGKDTVIVGIVCPDAATVDTLAARLDPRCVLSKVRWWRSAARPTCYPLVRIHDRLHICNSTRRRCPLLQRSAQPARNDTFGLYNAMARDPGGYLVEIQAFLNPDFLKPEPLRACVALYEKHFSTLRPRL